MLASAWVAIAPTPAAAAGTAEPTARNFEATATPHDSPSSDRATMENVMDGTYRGARRPTRDLGWPGAHTSRVPQRRGAPSVRRGDRRRHRRQRAVHADHAALLPRDDRPDTGADRLG